MTVLINNGIETLVSGARFEAANKTLRCHKLQVAIDGPEADARQPLLDPQVYLIGAGMVSAEAEFLQNHGPLLRFSQIKMPIVIMITITIINYFALPVKTMQRIRRKKLVLLPCFR